MGRPAKLAVVREREGNQEKRPIAEGVKLLPKAPDEPDWSQMFPKIEVGKKPGRAPAAPSRPARGSSDEERTGYRLAKLAWLIELYDHRAQVREWEERKRLSAEATRCRGIAAKVWAHLVPLLDSQGILAEADAGAMADHCVLQARLDQAERDITRNGIWLPGERGAQKNPSTTFANQCREKDRPHILDFGLTPGARDKLNPRKGGDEQGNPLFD